MKKLNDANKSKNILKSNRIIENEIIKEDEDEDMQFLNDLER